MTAAESLLPAIDFQWAGSTRVPARSTYGPYVTAYWEFIWGIEGSARVVSGDQEFTFTAGSTQLSPPGVRNFYEWTPRSSSSYGYVIFTMEHPADWPRYRSAHEGDLLPHLLEHVLWLDSAHPEGWHEAATIALGYAVQAFVSGNSSTRLNLDLELPQAVDRSLALVRRRWERSGPSQVPLKELADAAGVTREHLSRVFTKHLGLGPTASIRLLLLSRAAELLSHTNLGIAEIARSVGYSNEFHFSRAFRSVAGQSPTAFRRDPQAHLAVPVALRRIGRQLGLS